VQAQFRNILTLKECIRKQARKGKICVNGVKKSDVLKDFSTLIRSFMQSERHSDLISIYVCMYVCMYSFIYYCQYRSNITDN